MAHGLLEMFAPEWAISEAEAAELSAKLAKWRSHYPPSEMLEEKWMDLGMLIFTVAAVDGTRAKRWLTRRTAELKARKIAVEAQKQGGGPNIVSMDPRGR